MRKTHNDARAGDTFCTNFARVDKDDTHIQLTSNSQTRNPDPERTPDV